MDPLDQDFDLLADFGDEELELPLLPVRDAVVFPRMLNPLFVGRDRSMVAL
jgi:ATP-dependent Lon protease